MAQKQTVMQCKCGFVFNDSHDSLKAVLVPVLAASNVPEEIKTPFTLTINPNKTTKANLRRDETYSGIDPFENERNTCTLDAVMTALEDQDLAEDFKYIVRILATTSPRMDDPVSLQELFLNGTKRLISSHYPDAAVAFDENDPDIIHVQAKSTAPSKGDSARAASIGRKTPTPRRRRNQINRRWI